MQMYLWNAPNPDRDGDLDSDIVYHEYGHGLTWRMIGDMSGAIAGAIGEGMSDTLAIYFNGDDRVGEYSTNNAKRHPAVRPYTELPADVRRLQRHRRAFQRRDLRGDDVAPSSAVDRQGLEHRDSAPLHRRRHELHRRRGPRSRTCATASSLSITNLHTASIHWHARCTVWDASRSSGSASAPTASRLPLSITESFAKPAECTTPPANTPPTVTITSPASVTVLQRHAGELRGHGDRHAGWHDDRRHSCGRRTFRRHRSALAAASAAAIWSIGTHVDHARASPTAAG